MSEASVQERYAPHGICFGCGPANERGLRIRSMEQGDELVAVWSPEPHHQAFEGIVNGGILGALLDCHSNWAATIHLMHARGLDHPPCTVTADFKVSLRRPTPLVPLTIRARVIATDGDRVNVEAEVEAEGKRTASCAGTFVAVGEDHPAYHRW